MSCFDHLQFLYNRFGKLHRLSILAICLFPLVLKSWVDYTKQKNKKYQS